MRVAIDEGLLAVAVLGLEGAGRIAASGSGGLDHVLGELPPLHGAVVVHVHLREQVAQLHSEPDLV